jgi:hypothetical protein
VLRKLAKDYDPSDAGAAYSYVHDAMLRHEYVTGLLHLKPEAAHEFHALNGTPDEPLNQLPFSKVSPGSAVLAKIQARYR